MLVPVTAIYAALLGLVVLTLQALVGRNRLRSEVSLYDGGDTKLGVAIRRHANFAEHVPLALILLVIIELNGAPRALLHTLGVVLIAARIAHPFGLKPEFAAFVPARGLGAVATLLVTLVAIVVAIWQVI
jgi:hypothetical protein